MQPLVSVCCRTYNHEKYIADAIESFLMQKTDFPIEIIVHDDASVDNTANIIRKYEEKYPDTIKPIYQKENQYSKGINASVNFIYPKVQGRYIAFCEGDDYWNDPYKLQKQADFLESHNDYSMCFHGVQIVDTNKLTSGKFLGPYGKGSKAYPISKLGQGGFVHLSSVVLKSEFLKYNLPEWYSKSRRGIGGDFKMAIYMGIMGKCYFIDEVMSAYRTGVENSAMTRLKENNTYEKYYLLRNSLIKEIDEFYDYKFHNDMEEIVLQGEFAILSEQAEKNLPEMKTDKYRHIYSEIPFKGKIGLHLKYYMPGAYNVIKSALNNPIIRRD